MRTTIDDENLKKNGVSIDEVEQVLASDLSFAEEMNASDRGNDRAMIVGWTHAGRVLEIGVEYFGAEHREHIFHAMDAGKSYQQQFERRIRDGG